MFHKTKVVENTFSFLLLVQLFLKLSRKSIHKSIEKKKYESKKEVLSKSVNKQKSCGTKILKIAWKIIFKYAKLSLFFNNLF